MKKIGNFFELELKVASFLTTFYAIFGVTLEIEVFNKRLVHL